MESIRHMELAFRVLGEAYPSESAHPTFNILMSNLLSKTNPATKIFDCIDLVCHQLRDEGSPYYKKIKLNSRNYLIYYCKGIFEYLETITERQENRFIQSINIKFTDIDFDMVKYYYKTDFPVKGPLSSEGSLITPPFFKAR